MHVVPEIPVAHPVETSTAQLSSEPAHLEQHMIWCGGVMSLVDYSNQLRRKEKPEERASQLVQIRQRKLRTSSRHTSFRNWCSCCVRARAADDPHHRQPHKEPEFPIIMADCCLMQDAPGGELFTILDMLDVALGMMAAISAEEKGPATYLVSVVVEHLRAWETEKGDLPHLR